jgi:type I restriction enzyme R subunit
MSPEEKARLVIDEQLEKSGWIIQDMKALNLAAGRGVAIREYPTSSCEVDYALFVDGAPVGIAEEKRESGLYPYFGATGQVGYIDDFLMDITL